jgi:hypothetical protein
MLPSAAFWYDVVTPLIVHRCWGTRRHDVLKLRREAVYIVVDVVLDVVDWKVNLFVGFRSSILFT